MVDIQSKEVIDKMSEELKVQPALALPRTLTNNIQPVFEVGGRRNNFIASGFVSDSASNTIHTCKTGVRTFIYGHSVSITKDAVNTSTFSRILVTHKDSSATTNLAAMAYEPLTAASNLHVEAQYEPLELKEGSTIVLTNSTAIASIDNFSIVFLFELDPQ